MLSFQQFTEAFNPNAPIDTDALTKVGLDFDRDLKPYLRGGTNFTDVTASKLAGLPWKAPGVIYRAFKLDWADDLDRLFGTRVLHHGAHLQYSRPPYTAWSDTESTARSFLPASRESNEFAIVLQATPSAEAVLCDFRQLQQYYQYKWHHEAEIVLRPHPVAVRVLNFEAPKLGSQWDRQLKEAKTPQDDYEEYGIILPDGTIQPPQYRGYDHNDICQEAGFRGLSDALEKGAIRFSLQSTDVFIEAQDKPEVKRRIIDFLRGQHPDRPVQIDFTGKYRSVTRIANYPSVKKAIAHLRYCE